MSLLGGAMTRGAVRYPARAAGSARGSARPAGTAGAGRRRRRGATSRRSGRGRARGRGVDPSAAGVAGRARARRRGGPGDRVPRGGGRAVARARRRDPAGCCCDVLEHVDDLEAVVAETAPCWPPGGDRLLRHDQPHPYGRLVAIKSCRSGAPPACSTSPCTSSPVVNPAQLAARCAATSCRRGRWSASYP